MDSFGWIEHHTGHHHRAIDHYQQALALYRTVGNTTEAADTLNNLGHPHRALGNQARTSSVWQEALNLYRQQGRHTDAERVQRQLADLDAAPVGQSDTADSAKTGRTDLP